MERDQLRLSRLTGRRLLTTMSTSQGAAEAAMRANYLKTVERETGIEPATNSLEGCDSTTELLPPWRGEVVEAAGFEPT